MLLCDTWSIREEADHDSARDADPLVTFLGLYLATFQWLEGKLDQIILLAEGFDRWAETQERLARMDNQTRVDAMARVAADATRFPLVADIDGWPERVAAVAERLREERWRRNRVMHSQFLMEGVEHSLPAITSIRRRGDAERFFDQEVLSRPRMDEILKEIAALYFAVGMVAVQLRHAMPHGSEGA